MQHGIDLSLTEQQTKIEFTVFGKAATAGSKGDGRRREMIHTKRVRGKLARETHGRGGDPARD